MERSHTSEHEGAIQRRAPDSATVRQDAPHPLLVLQRQIGNAQVARMLAQRTAASSEEVPEVGVEGGPVSGDLAQRIQAQRGGGSALDAGTQARMEADFGTSFADVRLHAGGESAALNRSISAKAFTTGNDIFLGHGASPGDQGLLAHELTHVVQQRSMAGSGPMTVGAAGDSYEQQADAMVAAVTSGAMQPARAEEA